MTNIETPSYYINDNQNVTNSIRQAIYDKEQNNAMQISNSISNIKENIDESNFQTSLNGEVGKYLTNTTNISMQNELYNTNMYMKNSMSMQEEEISNLSERARNHIMKYREKYKLKLYDIYYQKFQTTIIIYGMFFLGIFGVLLALSYKQDPPVIKSTVSWSIILGISILYVLIIYLFYKNNQSRRQTDWTKFYFGDYGVRKDNNCS